MDTPKCYLTETPPRKLLLTTIWLVAEKRTLNPVSSSHKPLRAQDVTGSCVLLSATNQEHRNTRNCVQNQKTSSWLLRSSPISCLHSTWNSGHWRKTRLDVFWKYDLKICAHLISTKHVQQDCNLIEQRLFETSTYLFHFPFQQLQRTISCECQRHSPQLRTGLWSFLNNCSLSRAWRGKSIRREASIHLLTGTEAASPLWCLYRARLQLHRYRAKLPFILLCSPSPLICLRSLVISPTLAYCPAVPVWLIALFTHQDTLSELASKRCVSSSLLGTRLMFSWCHMSLITTEKKTHETFVVPLVKKKPFISVLLLKCAHCRRT